jgi:hypothetical protein
MKGKHTSVDEAAITCGRVFRRCFQLDVLRRAAGFLTRESEVGLDLSPVLRQMVKTQNPLNGELSHGVVT